MSARFNNFCISTKKGQSISLGPEGLVIDGDPRIFIVAGHLYVYDIVILTHEQAKLILSPDGDGVEAREKLRKDLKSNV